MATNKPDAKRDAEKLSRPMFFEGSGWLKPFGYISTSPAKLPVFELNTMLDFDSDELVKFACRMAAANELLAALKTIVHNYDIGDYTAIDMPAARAAIAAAEGR